MSIRRLRLWDIFFVLVLIATIPLIVDNVAAGRYSLAVLTVVFLAGGLGAVRYSVRHGDAIGPRWPGRTPAPIPIDDDRVSPAQEMHRDESGRLPNWLLHAIISGFVATGILSIGLLVAYELALLIGSNAAGASTLAQWFWALTHNPVTESTRLSLSFALALNFVAGIGWAVIYAGFAEPRIPGPAWRRGVIFSLAPWILSLVVFLPLVGGGFFGIPLHAGPLPVLGNLVAHLLYGVTLGVAFAGEQLVRLTGELEDQEDHDLIVHAERMMASGILPGLVLGGIIGLAGSHSIAPGYDPWLVTVFGAIAGSAVGLLIGSFAGLSGAPVHAQTDDPVDETRI